MSQPQWPAGPPPQGWPPPRGPEPPTIPAGSIPPPPQVPPPPPVAQVPIASVDPNLRFARHADGPEGVGGTGWRLSGAPTLAGAYRPIPPDPSPDVPDRGQQAVPGVPAGVPIWATTLPRRRWTATTTAAVIVAVVLLLAVAASWTALLLYLSASAAKAHAQGFGLGAFALLVLLALVPLTIVLVTVAFVDRWAPAPWWARGTAFLWGAGGAVGLALLTSTIYAGPIALIIVVEAPLVEECAKGLGLILLIFAFRSKIDGPVSGIVYAATIAAGFAFTENILYFGNAWLKDHAPGESTPTLLVVFILRGVLLPFGHALFTACIGFAVGLGMRRGRLAGLGMFFVGYPVAVLLHGGWNAIPNLLRGGTGIAVLGVALGAELLLLCIEVLAVIALRRAEGRTLRAGLAAYAEAGWITPPEINLLGSWRGRSRLTAWGRQQRPSRRREVRHLIRDATALAANRTALGNGLEWRTRIPAERDLLQRVAQDRIRLMAPATG